MLSSIASFAVTEMLGTTGTYIVAGLCVAAGVYLAGFVEVTDKSPLYPLMRPLRTVGVGLAVFGILLGAAGYFKHVGAAQCEAAVRLQEVKVALAATVRDRDAWKAAAEARLEDVRRLAQQKEEADGAVENWRQYTDGLAADLRGCRRATADDDRRLCGILGDAVAACRSSGVRSGSGVAGDRAR